MKEIKKRPKTYDDMEDIFEVSAEQVEKMIRTADRDREMQSMNYEAILYQKPFYTRKEIMLAFDIKNVNTLYNWEKIKLLLPIKVSNKVVYLKKDVYELINTLRQDQHKDYFD